MKDQSIRFIVIQVGYALFGVGNTRDEAIEDSTKWLEDDDYGKMSVTKVEAALVPLWAANYCDLCILSADDDDKDNIDAFNSYLTYHEDGGFVQHEGAWYEV